MNEWKPIESCPEDRPVKTAIIDHTGMRNEQPLRKKGNLFFFTDMSMYVYYTPTHWKPIT